MPRLLARSNFCWTSNGFLAGVSALSFCYPHYSSDALRASDECASDLPFQRPRLRAVEQALERTPPTRVTLNRAIGEISG